MGRGGGCRALRGASSEQQGGLPGQGGVLDTGGQAGLCCWVVVSASGGAIKPLLL